MREENPRRILVLGGTGFLGSHLCERLLAQGLEVLCVDNYYTGTKRNIAHLVDEPFFEVLRHDVTFPLYVEVDQIYHLAWQSALKREYSKPLLAMFTVTRNKAHNRKRIGGG
jgi:UDP-glucuronate decarboxylase